MAAAYSLNFTIVNYGVMSGGFLTAYQTASARPFVSTVNFGNGTNAVANAAIVPAHGSGSIDVYSSGATNLVIDINGYFIEPAVTSVIAGNGMTVAVGAIVFPACEIFLKAVRFDSLPSQRVTSFAAANVYAAATIRQS